MLTDDADARRTNGCERMRWRRLETPTRCASVSKTEPDQQVRCVICVRVQTRCSLRPATIGRCQRACCVSEDVLGTIAGKRACLPVEERPPLVVAGCLPLFRGHLAEVSPVRPTAVID